jgi:hypothetical protein
MNSLRQNQKKPFIDDEGLRRKKLQVAFSTVSVACIPYVGMEIKSSLFEVVETEG